MSIDASVRKTQVPGHDLSALPERMRGLQSHAERIFLVAFRPCGLFLLAEISRTVRIVLRLVGETGFDGVLIDVFTVTQKTFAVPDALVGKTGLPDFELVAQFLFRAIREISFYKPDRLLNRLAAIKGELQMEMIGHRDKVMQPEFFGGNIGSENVNKEIGHAFRLQKRASLNCPPGHKESARAVLDAIAVCVARGSCHDAGAKARNLYHL